MQIRLWRQGKKTVAVFDGESRVSRRTRINHDDKLLDFEPPATKANLKNRCKSKRVSPASPANARMLPFINVMR
jgi:hypothetical protein